MSHISRARALQLVGVAVGVPSCVWQKRVTVGAKNFPEQYLLCELYRQALDNAGFSVTPLPNISGTKLALAALVDHRMDLYPEYTGTAFTTVMHREPLRDRAIATVTSRERLRDSAETYALVKAYFAQNERLIWLDRAPMSNSQALATRRDFAATHALHTLTRLSDVAPYLRLGAVADFTRREDGLPGLQRAYGGFLFREVRLFEIGRQYEALKDKYVDVIVAFTTDGKLQDEYFQVLEDDQGFWPPYNVAPVVREDTLSRYPNIANHLNAVSKLLTDQRMRELNQSAECDDDNGNCESLMHDVAQRFLHKHGLA